LRRASRQPRQVSLRASSHSRVTGGDAPLLDGVAADRLLQGPLADGMTHAGQIALLRRLAMSTWNGPAGWPTDLRLEWRFISVRWLGILFMTPGIHLAGFSEDQMRAAYGVLAIAATYNVGLQLVVPRRPVWFASGYVTAFGDALLNASMVALAGGFDSPLYYILFTVTISAAMRYGYRPALGMAAIFITLDAAEQLPRFLLAGPFLFRSGFLLITAGLAGYLREQARSAENALQRRLEQANVFNEATATLTATLEADATLQAVAASARLLLSGRCAVLRPTAEISEHDVAQASVTYHGKGCSRSSHAKLLMLCEEYATPAAELALRPALIDTRDTSGERVFVLILRRPGQAAPLGVGLDDLGVGFSLARARERVLSRAFVHAFQTMSAPPQCAREAH